MNELTPKDCLDLIVPVLQRAPILPAERHSLLMAIQRLEKIGEEWIKARETLPEPSPKIQD